MKYSPNPPPAGYDKQQSLTDWITQELQNVSRAISEQETPQLRVLAVEPARPVEGMLARANGTNWNPGAGAGVYEYLNGGWHKL